MKSEERHRLQETELEKWGRHARASWESFSKNYGKPALIGLGVACLAAVIIAWWFMSSAAAEAERWKAVVAASFDTNREQSMIQLERAADMYADTAAGQWAALLEAEQALREGVAYSRSDRKACLDELMRARDGFARLENSDSEIIKERRAFGMARCLEALAGFDLTKDEKQNPTDAYGKNVSAKDALDAYKKFVEVYGAADGETEPGGQSIFVSFAEQRIKALNRIITLSSQGEETFFTLSQSEFPMPGDRPKPDDGASSADAREEAAMQELEALVKGAEKNAQRQNPDDPTLQSPDPEPQPPADKNKPSEPAKAEKNKPAEPVETDSKATPQK